MTGTAGGAETDLVRRLAAKDEIRDLAMRYALAMDTRDERLMLSLWSDSSPGLSFPDLDLHVIRDAVIPSWASRGPSVMVVSNHIVDLHDLQSAEGTVYCLVRIELGGRLVEQQVAYLDRYVRGEHGWQFLSRRHLLAFGIAWSENPFAAEPANWPRRQTGRGELWDLLAQRHPLVMSTANRA